MKRKLKKKPAAVLLFSATLLFGGAVGASVTTLNNSAQGLKANYTASSEKYIEEVQLYDLRAYEEEKVAKLEGEAASYYEQKKAAYAKTRQAAVDKDYENAKAEVFAHIDKIFK